MSYLYFYRLAHLLIYVSPFFYIVLLIELQTNIVEVYTQLWLWLWLWLWLHSKLLLCSNSL